MLYGRHSELDRLDRLLTDAARGSSGALVLRGEAGIGKSTLLEHTARLAEERGLRVLRATGSESEADLAFAGLLQLLRPVLGHAAALPAPQAEALDGALGTGAARGQSSRFLIGLAVLSLLAEAAEETPLLCLVDDVQWMDEPSAGALLFAARRLAAERVAVVFAAREEAPRDDGAEAGLQSGGLPELALSRLAEDDARLLLAALDVPAELRGRVIEQAEGNPLALAEFADPDDAAPWPSVRPLPAAERVLAAFRTRVAALPERTRLMLLVAAAETRGIVPFMLKAAEELGTGLADLAEAERLGMVTVTPEKVAFRHPLIRAAVYQGASTARRIAVHQALADASTGAPDCHAKHRAAAVLGPDEGAAAELEALADRARDRGGSAAAANVYAHAARLTPDRTRRLRRLTAAAWAAQQAGHAEQAAELAARAARDCPASATERLAELAYIRSFWLFEDDRAGEAARLLIEHAPGSRRAADMLRTAVTYGWFSGEPGAVREASALLERYGDGSAADGAARGVAYLVHEDFARALPLASALLASPPADSAARMHAISLAGHLADDAVLPLVQEEIEWARREGLIGRLPYLLHVLARQQIYDGRHREAESTAAEAAAIARDTGLRKRISRLDHLMARIPAVEGDEGRVRELVSTELSADGCYGTTALALLDLGLGRYEGVLRRLEEALRGPSRHGSALVFAAADQVEAAVRSGEPSRAAAPARRFAAWARASGRSWARAVALRNEALLGESPESAFSDALKLHAEGGRPFERARTSLLYGEHLRRARRRTDARAVLREALSGFERLGARPWAERALAELRAAGEVAAPARDTAPSPVARLTPQELQVVRLAASGTSSRDIAAQLFLSPRTVEYHLYKAYPKLGVGSRRELSGLDLSG